MDELEIMRRQLAEMKTSLDSQQIVTHDLMRRVMRGRASWLNTFFTGEVIALPITVIMIGAICAGFGVSMWITAVYAVMAAVDVAVDYRTMRIPPRVIGNYSVVELRRFLIRQKRERRIQLWISGPLCVLWVLWLVLSLISRTTFDIGGDPVEVSRIGGVIGGVIGAVAGIIVVIVIYRKQQRTNDDLIDDTRDLEE